MERKCAFSRKFFIGLIISTWFSRFWSETTFIPELQNKRRCVYKTALNWRTMGATLSGPLKEVVGLWSYSIVTMDHLGPKQNDQYRGVVDLWRWSNREVIRGTQWYRIMHQSSTLTAFLEIVAFSGVESLECLTFVEVGLIIWRLVVLFPMPSSLPIWTSTAVYNLQRHQRPVALKLRLCGVGG